jgi:hypothetical protein
MITGDAGSGSKRKAAARECLPFQSAQGHHGKKTPKEKSAGRARQLTSVAPQGVIRRPEKA